ncbi:MAG: glycosyltransferase family 39 protein [Nanoarchaeota archaeon]
MGIVNKNKLTIIILGIILLFALILRIYSLGSSPLWFDESISSLASQKIAEKGIPLFDSGLFYSRALIFHYIQAFFIFLFGATDAVARLASVLFGLGTVILAFLIGKEFNKPAGIISALITSVLFLEIVYSRQARFYQAFQFLFFLTLFLLYKSKTSKKYAYISSISLIVLVQTHIAGLVLVPLFIIMLYKEHKDIKLLIIPLLVGIYFGLSFFNIQTSASLGSIYAEEYTSRIFKWLRAFFIISLIGMPFAYKMNKRMFYILLVPSILLFTGLFFIKVFALRYAYFVTLSIIIFISTILSYLYKQNKILFAITLVATIIYPSNLFFEANYLTVVIPSQISINEITEPVINYKSLSQETQNIIKSNTLVTLSSPGVEWYLKKPDYIIPFSLNGLESGYALYEGVDAYTGAEIFNNQSSDFILLEDFFGYFKLSEKEKSRLNDIKQNCSIIEESNTLKVYSCIM